MEIRAYDEAYLASARNILGHAADFAIMTLNLDPDFWQGFNGIGSIKAVCCRESPLCCRNERLRAGKTDTGRNGYYIYRCRGCHVH